MITNREMVMSDLTDEEIVSIERSLGGPSRVAVSNSETCRMLHELQRHRAMVKRLEAWAVQLESDTFAAGGIGVGPFIAAELRNRMKGG